MTRKTTRTHARGEESRRRILEATLAIAAERGYDGTSIGQVSKAAGLPVSSIYWHFKDKDALLLGALEHAMAQWTATIPRWTEPATDAPARTQIAERLRGGCRAMTTTPGFWRLGLMLALEHRVEEPSARRRFLELRQRAVEALATWWEPVVPAHVRERDPEAVPRMVGFHLAAMDGLFLGMLCARDWDLDRIAGLLADGMSRHLEQLAEAAA